MPLVNVWECEGCNKLEKGTTAYLGDGDDVSSQMGTRDDPPDGWHFVTVEVVGQDKQPTKTFCSEKCVGLHFRPPVRRGKGDDGDEEEGHPSK